METLFKKILDNATGIVAAGIVGVVWLNLKWLFSSKRNMERILKEIIFMRSNVNILFRLQGPQIMSLKATLEAQRDGECNGNVDKAILMMEEAKKEFDEHLLSSFAGLGDEAGNNGTARGQGIGSLP